MQNTNQLEIEVPIQRCEGDRYAEMKAKFENDKGMKDYEPIFLAYLPSTKKYSATRCTSRTLLESFNFIIVE